MVYIPNKTGNRKVWGDLTGTKSELANRNIQIRQESKDGIVINVLSEKYSLSVETIKKIVYSH
ncbi:CD3324 family protein [Clostridium estertheticum]|uniref:CD3324 family protein n=1 Tax=Clostridium estertheticum TaxID=238834 RepID=UPI00311A97CF